MKTYHEIIIYLQNYIKRQKSLLKTIIIHCEKNGDREQAIFAKGRLDELLKIEYEINVMLGLEDVV